MSRVIHYYRIPGESSENLLKKNDDYFKTLEIESVETEYCFNVELQKPLEEEEKSKLIWILTETFQPENVKSETFLSTGGVIVEVGPRLAFSTAWSSNCLSMLQACGIESVGRIERSRRYKITSRREFSLEDIAKFASHVHDRMTECIYTSRLDSFAPDASQSTAASVSIIPLLSEGKSALKKINEEKGLGFDDWDLDFYSRLFIDTLKRDPTDVECFDMAQSNSEHSRHWFFCGKMIIDGKEKVDTLFRMVKDTLVNKENSVIAFHDNSSAITGYEVPYFSPEDPSNPSSMKVTKTLLHPLLTAETHNFPSGVAPFAGAETGTGGRLRDVQATGRGAHTLAGVSAYCVGNLNIPSHPLPWETPTAPYPSSLALPVTIEIEASNGASDYGNKFGEPVVTGFTRSFGQVLPSGERVEYIKPIMFTAGVGLLHGEHSVKGQPEVGMVVCKIGGPAYRIGMGGGAASSRVQGTADSALDFNAVQRGDAEMENRMNRVIRACINMARNPIVSIHDQGAGGNGNVLKEIVEPLGARYDIRAIPVGDPTLSVLEIWGAEYQENNAFLVHEEDLPLVLELGKRENCPVSPVGKVTGDGKIVVVDSTQDVTSAAYVPYDLPLSLILGNMPQKTFSFTTPIKHLNPFALPLNTTFEEVVHRVLRLLDVGSKRFLTNKVDRSVSGLISQQQCVGPLQTPLSNVAVLALSYFDTRGMAVAVGEQPIKGLVSNAAQARMTAGEVLSNLVFAKITDLGDVKMSGNWMWAAKMEGEGAKMWEACEALKDALIFLGPAIDGGKDSLSMAAKVSDTLVKSPGTLTLTSYAACPNITLTVTPDLKAFNQGGTLLLVDLGQGRCRVGGTALTTVFSQLGDESPDMDDMALFKRCFNCIQYCIDRRLFTAGHDRSDGGLFVTLIEMAIAGNCGLEVHLEGVSNAYGVIGQMFSEELGFVFEVLPVNLVQVLDIFCSYEVPCVSIGTSTTVRRVVMCIDGVNIIDMSLGTLRDAWEDTSFALEKLQCNVDCAVQEREGMNAREGPVYIVPYAVSCNPVSSVSVTRHRVAVIRQEGSNGDREMLAAFYAAGVDAWDVNMYDLLTGRVALDYFRGVVFCGGFSYADVNDSAKGWAGVIKFNPELLAQFNWFKDQRDRFSLGVCNGCQLMALLGWVPFPEVEMGVKQARFLGNGSGRFESRWVAVKVLESPAVLLHCMEGSTLGVWCAHGEGRVYFPNEGDLQVVEDRGLAPVRYVGDDGDITVRYPMNPNGSVRGIASLCSADGRHLAMMPHPERCFQLWQWPYKPKDYAEQLEKFELESAEEDVKIFASPWLKMFQNAKRFCDNTSL